MFRPPAEGESFGRYRLLRRLGQGGMGVVYAAHDPSLDREVAIKLVIPHLAADEAFRARFQHEATVLARLDSPRIVRIYDHGEHDGILYLVTQLVPGGDLLTLINRQGLLPPALATAVIRQLVEALGDAHAVNVVHRDIKPANVLLRERGRELEAYLCDFGIATTPGTDLSRTGTVAGSLPYMAPERHRGESAGPQGDVYAAGCLLWHALTGAAPYAGTDVEVAMAHINAAIPQLPGRDEFSRRANAVLRRAMAKDPRQRYPTARALLTDLTALAPLAPDAITLPGATAIRLRLDLTPRRRWRSAAVAVLAVVGVVAATAVASDALRDGRRQADPSTDPVAATSTAAGGATPGPTHTLFPRPVTKTRGGQLVTVPPGTDLSPGRPPRSGPGGPRGTRTVRATVSATATRTPAPRAAYRCWNGESSATYDACGTPRGSGGVAWMFPNKPNLGCHGYDIDGTTADVEAWICGYSGPDGGKNWITFARWKSTQSARTHYWPWIDHDDFFHNDDWVIDGEYAGRHWFGRHGDRAGHRRWRSAWLYDVGPWTAAINAESLENRSRGRELVRPFRAPSEYRRVRLS